ncbi:hypothetical protein [Bacillus smithii]|uniref:hypothetical protein n=1 Tax=Bacillus smithii TaxID=1479 RepID=UPI003D1A0240
MGTYSESEYFIYDGINSLDFGIYNVKTSAGLFEEKFLPTRSIVEEKTFGRPEPYFYGFEYTPAEIPLSFYFADSWDQAKIKKVCEWFFQSYYKPLAFETDLSRVFYVAYQGDPNLFHNGLKEGYVEISMRANSPFSFTPVIEKSVYVSNGETKEIEIENIGSLNCFPIITINKIGDGDVTITNLSNGGQQAKITGLLDKETVTIDGENEDVETNLPNVYRYNNYNNVFIELVKGVNRLTITGESIVTFSYQCKRLI